jgi:Tetratricopeptide repeat
MLGVRGFALALVMSVAVFAQPASAQNLAEAVLLNQQVVQLYQQGKYAEATELAKRVLAIREARLSPDHPPVSAPR